MHTIEKVTFFGSSSVSENNQHFISAKNLSREIAKTGRGIVNGGGPGIMLAATLGAREAKGKSTVVYYKPELATTFEGKSTANLADVSYRQANYILRTKKLLELGDAYIIFKGGTGTLSELGMAWGVARLYFGHHKPLILYGDFWYHIIATLKENMMIRDESLDVFQIVSTIEGAIEALASFEKILEKNRHDHDHTKCNGEECHLLL